MDHSLFTSLDAVASLINASSDLDQTLRHLLEAVCQRPPWSTGAIMRIDSAGGFAQTVARHGPSDLGARRARRGGAREPRLLAARPRRDRRSQGAARDERPLADTGSGR